MNKKNCENCPKRGQCCKNFMLHPKEEQVPWAYTSKDTKERVISRLKKEDLPFLPTKVNKHRWMFKCSKISKNGKCTIYKNRPQLCRNFKIGSNLLCYYYNGTK